MTPELPSSEKERDGANPWSKLVPQTGRLTRAIREPRKPDESILDAMKKYYQKSRQEDEINKEAAFTISIDKGRLAEIQIPKPENGLSIRDPQEAWQEQRAVLERFLKLPEKLDFKPGITLIVGENGTGKSTFAKALFLHADYLSHLGRGKKDAALSKDPKAFLEAGNSAFQFVFKPSRMIPYEQIWLKRAGIGPKVAQTMVALNFYMPEKGEGIKYWDFTEIMGSQNRGEEDYVFHDLDKKNSDGFTGWGDHQSHRQTVDRLVVNNELGREKSFYPTPRIYFFDEPETAMSPRRHRNLTQEIAEWITNGSIVIVPTNSVILYESDLPRIDLDFPERGIHKPSEYKEVNHI